MLTSVYEEEQTEQDELDFSKMTFQKIDRRQPEDEDEIEALSPSQDL